MQVINKDGTYEPATLAADFAAAGIPVFGVTCTETDGAVTSVQIICDDDISDSSIDAVVAAYTPPVVSNVATSDDASNATATIITQNLSAAGVTREQLPPIFQQLLSEAQSGVPFFEKYALDPSMTSQQWTDFQALDQTTKDRLLYDAVRTLAALMRYLTGDLSTAS